MLWFLLSKDITDNADNACIKHFCFTSKLLVIFSGITIKISVNGIDIDMTFYNTVNKFIVTGNLLVNYH